MLCARGLSAAILELERQHLITHLLFADDSLLFFRATLEDCAGVRHCLNLYEKASGQLINHENSGLSFRPNSSADMIDAIKTMLSIPVVHEHELYLGLPVCSMRNKKLKFLNLTERVSKRLQGWGRKIFSSGGKESLLKSVIQSIPTYSMTCFYVPKAICDKLKESAQISGGGRKMVERKCIRNLGKRCVNQNAWAVWSFDI